MRESRLREDRLHIAGRGFYGYILQVICKFCIPMEENVVSRTIAGRAPLGLIFFTAIIFAAGVPAFSAQPAVQSSNPSPLRVAVSIPPMAEWVSRIAGNRAIVQVVLPPGASPHAFEPSPRQLMDLGKADVWFVIGLEFERGLKPKISALYPLLRIVDVTSNVQFRTLKPGEREKDGDSHEQGGSSDGRDPVSEGLDVHTWLGLDAARAEMAVIRDTLSALDPQGASMYRTQCDRYQQEAENVFKGLRTALAPLSGSRVFVYHPSFGYFLDYFGIEQIAVEAGGKEPSQRELAELIALAKKEKARAVFVQAQFSQNAAKAVAQAAGAVVVPIDPLAQDWLANMTRIGQALRSAAGK